MLCTSVYLRFLPSSALVLARRRFYCPPYAQGAASAPGTWPDTNAFLGTPTDANTGLDILGARNYDPRLGRFVSISPVPRQNNSKQLNGYTYAADNPITSSDPSGLCNRPDLGCPTPHQQANEL